jgi:hypothetical protein
MDYHYKIEHAYCWYNQKSQIVKMYFIEGIPFTFDELDPESIFDEKLRFLADTHREWELEDLYQKSDYLIAEQVHPCLFPVNLKNPDDLPKD